MRVAVSADDGPLRGWRTGRAGAGWRKAGRSEPGARRPYTTQRRRSIKATRLPQVLTPPYPSGWWGWVTREAFVSGLAGLFSVSGAIKTDSSDSILRRRRLGRADSLTAALPRLPTCRIPSRPPGLCSTHTNFTRQIRTFFHTYRISVATNRASYSRKNTSLLFGSHASLPVDALWCCVACRYSMQNTRVIINSICKRNQ